MTSHLLLPALEIISLAGWLSLLHPPSHTAPLSCDKSPFFLADFFLLVGLDLFLPSLLPFKTSYAFLFQ